MIASSKELEPGMRAMLVHADGLFRLDVAISGDTLRTIVRNHSSGELHMLGRPDRPEGTHVVTGDAIAYQPCRTGVAFTLGSGKDMVEVDVTIGTFQLPERGTVRVSAQAIVRGTTSP